MRSIVGVISIIGEFVKEEKEKEESSEKKLMSKRKKRTRKQELLRTCDAPQPPGLEDDIKMGFPFDISSHYIPPPRESLCRLPTS